jgi:hypothetical protein
MPFSEDLYNAALYVYNNWFSRLRTVDSSKKIIAEDHNSVADITKKYMETMGQALPVTPRSVKDLISGLPTAENYVYASDLVNLKILGKAVMDAIASLYGDPYTTDPEWNTIYFNISSVPEPKFGDWGSGIYGSSAWNTVMKYCVDLTNLILRHTPYVPPPPPSIVTYISSGAFTAWSSQRKLFYAKGRYWIFYGSAGNIYYRSSTDGVNWSDEYVAIDTTYDIILQGGFDIYADSDNVAIFCYQGAGQPTGGAWYLFRKGIIPEDTPYIPAQNWSPLSFNKIYYYDGNYPAVGRGADGLWWVATGVNPSGSNFAYKVWSSPDGQTWTERYSIARNGFPLDPPGPTFNARYVTTFILSATNGKVYFFFVDYNWGTESNMPYISWLEWDGSAMSIYTHQLTHAYTGNVSKNDKISASIDGNNKIHLVWKGSDGALYYQSFDGTNWSEEICLDSATVSEPCISIDTATNAIHVFWIKNNVIYHRKYLTSWGDIDTPFGTSFNSPIYLTSSKMASGQIMAAWREGTAAPYTIYFGRV